MKKCLLALALFGSVVSSSFAGFFDNRFFEIKVDLGVEVANNSIQVFDYLVEHPVINLSEIARSVPGSGFNLTTKLVPEVDITLNIPKGLYFGVQTGVQTYASIGLSKELFELLGGDNDFTVEESKTITLPDSYVDLFAYVSVAAGWNGKKLKWRAIPSVYSTVAHAINDGSYATVTNKSDGTVGYDLVGKTRLYTPIAIPENFTDGSFAFDEEILKTIWQNVGFDMGFAFDYDLFSFLTISGTGRIPITPSKLTYVSSAVIKSSMETSLTTIAGGTSPNPSFDKNLTASEAAEYTMHRPMKFTASADLHPFGRFFKVYGGVGIGFEHPFAQDQAEQDFYIDYKVGARISFINMLSLSVSTERTDQIFINKATASINLRLVEIDVGVAAEGTSFASSFTGAGLGAFATVCIGL